MRKIRKAASPPIGEITDEIHIDTSLIPDHVRDNLAAATLDFIQGILKDPDASKRLRERQAARLACSTPCISDQQSEEGR